MKKILMICSLIFVTTTVFAQNRISAYLMSPFALVTRLAETGVVLTSAGVQTILGPFLTTRAFLESRGVAGQEQIKDELVAFDQDMRLGLVGNIEDIRQPGIRELFEEISRDEEELARIHTFYPEGSLLLKLSTVVTLKLFY
jgi:hypothetical protein